MRLVDRKSAQQWDGRGHFFAAAAEAMRRILVESARHKRRLKAAGNGLRQPLENVPISDSVSSDRLLEIDDAISVLAGEDPQAAKVVELRYFAGLGHEEIAAVLGVAVYEARQKWTYARAWLRERMALSEKD